MDKANLDSSSSPSAAPPEKTIISSFSGNSTRQASMQTRILSIKLQKEG